MPRCGCGWRRPCRRKFPSQSKWIAPARETIHLFSPELIGRAQATSVPEGNGNRVDATSVDGTAWHAKLLQVFDDLEEGARYRVRFRAKATSPRQIILYGQISEPDGHGIGRNQAVPLTRDWQPYQYEFQAKDLAAWNRIEFHLGQQTGTVWIADFSVTKLAK